VIPDIAHTAPTSAELDIVVRELAAVSDLILQAAAEARTLAAAADWQSPAARAFHARAAEWAGEISSLGCVAETARLAAIRAREATWLPRLGGL
jgi:hypothetical protein